MALDQQTPGGVARGPWAAWLRRPRVVLALRVAALALIVAVAFIRVGRTWSVFAATADEPQHIAAGVEWHARTDRVQHEPWRTVNPPLARIAVGLGPYLGGHAVDARGCAMRSTRAPATSATWGWRGPASCRFWPWSSC